MSKMRAFVPPQAPRPSSQPATAPRFPAGSGGTAPSTAGRPFCAPPLHASTLPDLQAMLDTAQRQVDTLQSQGATHAAALNGERARFCEAIAALEQSRTRACRVLAKDAITLAVEIAHALAGKAFELDEARVIALLEEVLLEFSSEQPVQVRVAPSAVPLVQAHLAAEGTTLVQVEADPSLSPGDVNVEAERLVVDARLSERVAKLREELAAAVRSNEVLQDAESSEDADASEAPE